MARKPKALRPEAEGKTQAERFIETARQIGVDETGEAFERAIEKLVPPKRPAPGGNRLGRPVKKSKPPR